MDYTIWFWVLLGLLVLFFLVMIILYIVMSFAVPEGSDGVFRLKNVSIAHKGAATMDVLVHVAYRSGARTAKVADTASLTKLVQTVVKTPSFKAADPWASVAKAIGKQIWNDFDVSGVSVEVLVPGAAQNTENATYTRGYVTRLLHLDAV